MLGKWPTLAEIKEQKENNPRKKAMAVQRQGQTSLEYVKFSFELLLPISLLRASEPTERWEPASHRTGSLLKPRVCRWEHISMGTKADGNLPRSRREQCQREGTKTTKFPGKSPSVEWSCWMGETLAQSQRNQWSLQTLSTQLLRVPFLSGKKPWCQVRI